MAEAATLPSLDEAIREMNEELQGTQDPPAEPTADDLLAKALTTLDPAAEPLGKGIIGHPGNQGSEPAPPGASAFGANPADESSPNGQALNTPSAGVVDGGAEARINAARERERAAGNTSTTGLWKSQDDPAVNAEAERIMEALRKSDTNDSLDEAIEASDALELLTNALINHSATIITGMTEIEGRLGQLETMQKSIGDALALLIRSRLVEGKELSKSIGSAVAGEIRHPQPGIGMLGGGTPAGKPLSGVPQGVTKAVIAEGLQKAVETDQLAMEAYRKLSGKIDTTDLTTLWNEMGERVQELITKG